MAFRPSYLAWSQSIFCQPRMCLGIQLQPYSWAHYECLKTFNNPYLLTDWKTQRPDLLQAAWICSRTWEQLRRDMFKMRDLRAMTRETWRARREGFALGDAQMRQYMEDYQFTPDAWEGKGDGVKVQMGSAASFIFVLFLMEHCHFTESQAWNCPIARSICYRMTWLENQGLIEMKSERSEREHEIELALGLTTDWSDEAEEKEAHLVSHT